MAKVRPVDLEYVETGEEEIWLDVRSRDIYEQIEENNTSEKTRFVPGFFRIRNDRVDIVRNRPDNVAASDIIPISFKFWLETWAMSGIANEFEVCLAQFQEAVSSFETNLQQGNLRGYDVAGDEEGLFVYIPRSQLPHANGCDIRCQMYCIVSDREFAAYPELLRQHQQK
jgi:hypothetical protein